MSNLIQISVPRNVKIVCVGDIHAHAEQYFSLLEKVKPSNDVWLVSLGDIYDKGFGDQVSDKITDSLKEMVEKGHAYVVRGNHELKRIKKAKKDLSPQLSWLNKMPLAIQFSFEDTGFKLTALHAGVTPNYTENDLRYNSEVVYVRTVNGEGNFIPLKWIDKDGQKALVAAEDGKNWHEVYDGRFGYIASGHAAQSDGVPKFYTNSCNLDTSCYSTGILTAQTFSAHGLMPDGLIQCIGTAFSPGKKYTEE